MKSFLVLPLLFFFAVLVKFDFILNFLFVEKLNIFVQDIQMHLDDLRFFHKSDVLSWVSIGLAFVRVGGLLFRLVWLLRFEVHKLQRVLAGEVFEVLNVLEVHLVEYFLKIFGPDSPHVNIKLVFLLLRNHLTQSITGEGLLLLGSLLVWLL